MIENNKAWRSAETVRCEWLATFAARKTPPAGAETLIMAVVLDQAAPVAKEMHGVLPSFVQTLYPDANLPTNAYYSSAARYLQSQATTPKRAVMLTLAAILAAWHASTDVSSWRSRDPWNGLFMASLIEWGYDASPVERLLLKALPTTHTEADDDQANNDQADDLEDGAAEPCDQAQPVADPTRDAATGSDEVVEGGER